LKACSALGVGTGLQLLDSWTALLYNMFFLCVTAGTWQLLARHRYTSFLAALVWHFDIFVFAHFLCTSPVAFSQSPFSPATQAYCIIPTLAFATGQQQFED
jgi:hypothetical protein